MVPIRSVQPRLGTTRPRLSIPSPGERERELDRRRQREDPCRSLYKTVRWANLRLRIFVRDLFTCVLCDRIECNTSLLVCDHVEPHNGDVEKFWAGPFQTLCKACHDGEKQRLERRSRNRVRDEL